MAENTRTLSLSLTLSLASSFSPSLSLALYFCDLFFHSSSAISRKSRECNETIREVWTREDILLTFFPRTARRSTRASFPGWSSSATSVPRGFLNPFATNRLLRTRVFFTRRRVIRIRFTQYVDLYIICVSWLTNCDAEIRVHCVTFNPLFLFSLPQNWFILGIERFFNG